MLLQKDPKVLRGQSDKELSQQEQQNEHERNRQRNHGVDVVALEFVDS